MVDDDEAPEGAVRAEVDVCIACDGLLDPSGIDFITYKDDNGNILKQLP